MVDDWSKLMCTKHCSKTVVVVQSKQAPFGRVKAGASSMLIQPGGEKFYSWYIQWSIIGAVRYIEGSTSSHLTIVSKL